MASILVVDDEQNIRSLVAATLELEGHSVTEAANGTEALNKIKRRQFDAVLLDIMMPEMNGYEVLEQIRQMPSRADTPVIVVTAKHDPTGLAREVERGAVDHVVKPFFPTELVGAVERAIGSAPEAVEERRRILGSDAELYGSIRSLYVEAGEAV